jgi:hypothetical protein
MYTHRYGGLCIFFVVLRESTVPFAWQELNQLMEARKRQGATAPSQAWESCLSPDHD